LTFAATPALPAFPTRRSSDLTSSASTSASSTGRRISGPFPERRGTTECGRWPRHQLFIERRVNRFIEQGQKKSSCQVCRSMSLSPFDAQSRQVEKQL